MGRVSIIENMPPALRGKALENVAPQAADGNSELLFNALLYPNRSLPNAGFVAVMGIVVCVNIISAIYYYVLGAWPIIFFAGADVLAVWLAFKVSYRQGRHHERILLSDEALWVCRVLPSGHETRWRLQPFWTRVLVERPVQHETQVRLVSHGRTLVIGSFLSPAERGALASALQTALLKAKTKSVTP